MWEEDQADQHTSQFGSSRVVAAAAAGKLVLVGFSRGNAAASHFCMPRLSISEVVYELEASSQRSI